MKNRITNVCRSIPQNILISTVENFEKQLRLCLQENGAPFEQSTAELSTAKNVFELFDRMSDRFCLSWLDPDLALNKSLYFLHLQD